MKTVFKHTFVYLVNLLSVSQVMKIPPADLRKRLFITIRGEEALDYGGVAK